MTLARELADGARLKAPQTTIMGLQLSWLSGTSISASTGAAYIPGYGVLEVTAPITLTGITGLAPTALSHVYLYLSGATPALEISSTSPAAAFSGTARTKSGDTTRRYIGSVRTDANGAIYSFVQVGERVMYRFTWGITSRVLTNGMATTATVVDMSSWVPPFSRLVVAKMANTSTTTNAGFVIQTAADDVSGSTNFVSMTAVDANATAYVDFPVSMDRTIRYGYLGTAPGNGGAYIDVGGYIVSR